MTFMPLMSYLKRSQKILAIGTVLVISILSGFPAVTSSSTVLAQQRLSHRSGTTFHWCTRPLTYFGPAPSEVNPSYRSPLQLLRSGPFDLSACTCDSTFIQRAISQGETVWYGLTDQQIKVMLKP